MALVSKTTVKQPDQLGGGGGGDVPDNIVLWDNPSELTPETPWVTESMLDKSSFRSVVTSSSDSITIPAGKWLIIHTFDMRQVSPSSNAVFIYNLGNADTSNDTWAVPSTSGQNFYAKLCRLAMKTFSTATTCTVGKVTITNAATDKQYWVAIPII